MHMKIAGTSLLLSSLTLLPTLAVANGTSRPDPGWCDDPSLIPGDWTVIEGTNGDDELEVTSSKTAVFGHAGDDRLESSDTYKEDVLLCGGPGDDVMVLLSAQVATMVGGPGDDQMAGGYLDDVDMHGSEGDDEMLMAYGLTGGEDFGSNNRMYGDAGNDQISGFFQEYATLDGGKGDDDLELVVGNYSILYGGRGNDELFADSRELGPFTTQIQMFGDQGDDSLMSNSTSDIEMTGGKGFDAFTTDEPSDVLDPEDGEPIDPYTVP